MIIQGLGTATPTHSVAQSDTYNAAHNTVCDSDEQRRVMQLIYEGTGIQQRGSALFDQPFQQTDLATLFLWPRRSEGDRGPTTGARMEQYERLAIGLAHRAAQAALDDAQVSPEQVTHLVTVSCSGFQAPGFDIGLIESLGLQATTQRTHVGFMGCHGAFNGLRVAQGYAGADPQAVVLVCALELCTLHHHYGWSTDKVIANALFADGSAAAVCRGEANALDTDQTLRLHANQSALLPGTKSMMTWTIRDHGFEMTLSQKVPAQIEQHLRPFVEQLLARRGMTLEDVRGWAVHPGGPKILDACLTALELDSEDLAVSRKILREHGNMSSATVLFLIQELRRERRKGPIVALGFGPGLTFEGMLLEQ